MKTLRLFVIHTQSLTNRQGRLHGTIQTIRQTAQALGLDFQSILILKPDPSELIPNINNLNARVSYNPVGDPDFDALLHTLNIEEISNIEKHREAWRRILGMTSNDICMVMEDDNMLPPENVTNLVTILQAANQSTTDIWDYLDLNIAKPLEEGETDGPDKLALYPLHEHIKVLVSKQAYIINQKMAKFLLAETESIHFSCRAQMSYALYKHRDAYKIRITSKRLMLEGSKVGVYPSSIHSNNMLIYNAEYMQLWNMLNGNEPLDAEKASKIYESVAHVKNPDMMTLYGNVLAKLDRTKDAIAMWEQATEQVTAMQGMLNQQSEVLNNIIKIYQKLQKNEVEEYMKTPSKWAVAAASK